MKNVYIVKVQWFDIYWRTTTIHVFTKEEYAKDYCDYKNTLQYDDKSWFYYEREKIINNYFSGKPYKKLMKERELYKEE